MTLNHALNDRLHGSEEKRIDGMKRLTSVLNEVDDSFHVEASAKGLDVGIKGLQIYRSYRRTE